MALEVSAVERDEADDREDELQALNGELDPAQNHLQSQNVGLKYK